MGDVLLSGLANSSCLQSICQKKGIFIVLTFTVLAIIYFSLSSDKLTIVENVIETRFVTQMMIAPPKECTFPNTDPFDPALEGVVKKYPPLDCSNHTANIVYLEQYQLIRVNFTKVPLVLQPGRKFSHCRYKEVDRKPGSDKAFEFVWTSDNFTKASPIHTWHENIVTECFDDKGDLISRSYFPLIKRKAETEWYLAENYKRHLKKNKPLETLSFLLIGVDGMSKQNFERAMPKTRNFLLHNMSAIELHKYNKLAFETFPNVLALLTGHTPKEFYNTWSYNRTEWVDQINEAFLWSDARKLGYRTGVMLDASSITAFHYQKKGFNAPPADYYQRATVLAATGDKLMRGDDKNCIGDMPEVTKVHDYWIQMASMFGKEKTTPFFGYSFAVRVTHDDPDLAYIADDAYYKFVQDLAATKSLNNTVILWFSDHGPRFGPVRASYQGRVETSTPYLFFTFPPWFAQKYPGMVKTLRENAHRLTSHFDVYETMKDLLYFRPEYKPPGRKNERGISLFREIPRDRTCDQAGIPGEFCACGHFSKPDLGLDALRMVGSSLLDKINSFIGHESTKERLSNFSKDVVSQKNTDVASSSASDFGGFHRTSSGFSRVPQDFRHKCARLSMDRVESIYAVTNDQLRSLKMKSYRITIKTVPGNGLFEGLVNYPGQNGYGEVVGEVVRINMYRGQADCVHDPWIRQFCYCLNNKT